ncbi:uncharacterized protein BdWA1_003875 [Babesia duncani]|uniref:Uncharacterized protein n=1 Tax=Babesia duncani TaxID=323732 RepID=A0AAD9UMG9_9APIC|nr:hypothetical protein BdWA1_003875 [Babesia duncani]
MAFLGSVTSVQGHQALDSVDNDGDWESRIRQQLVASSQALAKNGLRSFCCLDDLAVSQSENQSGPENVPIFGRAVADGFSFTKFGEEYFSEAAAPVAFTWMQNDGSLVRYIADFVFYNKAERLVSLQDLGHSITELTMFGKLHHISLIHPVQTLIDAGHPLILNVQNIKKKLNMEPASNPLRIPKKLRIFPVKVRIVDWFFDFGQESSIWVTSINGVYYRLERSSGRFTHMYNGTQFLWDVIKPIIRNLPNPNSDIIEKLIQQITSGRLRNGDVITIKNIDVILDFIFTECRWHDFIFNQGRGKAIVEGLIRRIHPQHMVPESIVNLQWMHSSQLAIKYKDKFQVSLIPPIPATRQKRRRVQVETVKENIAIENEIKDEHMEIRSKVSGRIIKRGKHLELGYMDTVPIPKETKSAPRQVEKIEPPPTPPQQQEPPQEEKGIDHDALVQYEKKCVALALPSDFEYSNYNTESEGGSSDDGSCPVGTLELSNDWNIELSSPRYYPRDLPLRILGFYDADEIIDLVILSRSFSAGAIGSNPILPRLPMDILEALLLHSTSRDDTCKPEYPCTFKYKRPICLCDYIENVQANSTPTGLVSGYEWIKKHIRSKGLPTVPPESDIDHFYTGLLTPLADFAATHGFTTYLSNECRCEDLSDKKREVIERDLEGSITDSELVRNFIQTNGGCLYRGRFRRFGSDSNVWMPYVNSLRWNKRFKKVLRLVIGSSNYRYTIMEYTKNRDNFTISLDDRTEYVPLNLFFPHWDNSFGYHYKAMYSDQECFQVLPTFKLSLNVWEPEVVQEIEQMHDCVNSANARLEGLGLQQFKVVPLEIEQMEPVLGFGYKERVGALSTAQLLNPQMLCDYTWPFMMRVYLFYTLYTCKHKYKFSLNAAIWGDVATLRGETDLDDVDGVGEVASIEGDGSEGSEDTNEVLGADVGEEDNKVVGADATSEKVPGADVGNDIVEVPDTDSGGNEIPNIRNDLDNVKDVAEMTIVNAATLEGATNEKPENSNGDDEEEEEDPDDVDPDVDIDDELDDDELPARARSRGWGLNRYCPYYEFSIEWVPDARRTRHQTRGKISSECIEIAFQKMQASSFLHLDHKQRCAILAWLGEALCHSHVGRSFIDGRNEEFYQLKGQIVKGELGATQNAEVANADDGDNGNKRGGRRQKAQTREVTELEERYAQRNIWIGRDRYYNNYYFLGGEFGQRILVQTLPQTKFTAQRIARRAKILRLCSFGADRFKFDLMEFAKRFAQDRVFPPEDKPKRGRKQKKDPNAAPPKIPSKRASRAAQPRQEEVSNRLLIKRKKSRGRKARLKKPKLRRSRDFFDRQPTDHETVGSYFYYLKTIPPRHVWAIIDSPVKFKKITTRLSQYTVNERNLAMRMGAIESEFMQAPQGPLYMPIKPPSVAGQMLIALARGMYRMYREIVQVVTQTSVRIDPDTKTLLGEDDSAPTDETWLKWIARHFEKRIQLNNHVHATTSRAIMDACLGPIEIGETAMQLLELACIFEEILYRYQTIIWYNRSMWQRGIETCYGRIKSTIAKVQRQVETCLCRLVPNGPLDTLDPHMTHANENLAQCLELASVYIRQIEVHSRSWFDLLAFGRTLDTLGKLATAEQCTIFNSKALGTFCLMPTRLFQDLDEFKGTNLEDFSTELTHHVPTECLQVKMLHVTLVEVVVNTARETKPAQDPQPVDNPSDKEDKNPQDPPQIDTAPGDNTKIDDYFLLKGQDAAAKLQDHEKTQVPKCTHALLIHLESLACPHPDALETLDQDSAAELVPTLWRLAAQAGEPLGPVEPGGPLRNSQNDETVPIPRAYQGCPLEQFRIITPLHAKCLVPMQELQPYLQTPWIRDQACKHIQTGATGHVVRTGYANGDIWNSVTVKWDETSYTEQVNLWDIEPV